MPRPQRHVFICGQTRPEGHPKGSCGACGAAEVYQSLAQMLVERKLYGRFAVTQTGCLGPCHMGANVLVYPDGVLYNNMASADVQRLVDDHLLGGEPLPDKLAPVAVW